MFTKAAKLLYGICNFTNLQYIKKFDFNIKLAQNTTQFKSVKEQLKTFNFRQVVEASEYYKMAFSINELVKHYKISTN